MGMPINETLSDIEVPVESKDPKGVKDSLSKDMNLSTIQLIRDQILLIEKAVANCDPGPSLRVIRSLPITRRKLNAIVLRCMAQQIYPAGCERESSLSFIEKAPTAGKISTTPNPPIPEVDAYFHLLVLLKLIDSGNLEAAEECSNKLMQKLQINNRRTLNLIASKCYFYHSRVAELSDKFNTIRGFLHTRLRTAVLHSDYEGQAVLINCLLRNYLHYNLYEQADKLITKSNYPENACNNEWARYLYYLGRIKAARLEYSSSHEHLIQAMRKAPKTTALGFQTATQKLTTVVELLLGDIPERQIFKKSIMRRALAPYFELTKAVRLGNIFWFTEVLKKYEAQFRDDHTYFLILRLRNNVIKTAIRSIGMAYASISTSEIAKKLGLDDSEDAEYIVAKAIKDGVVEAVIEPETGIMRSRETLDIYKTREPQLAFHQRISFCLDLHNQSVKSMRFPPKLVLSDGAKEAERLLKEQQDVEIARVLSEEDEY